MKTCNTCKRRRWCSKLCSDMEKQVEPDYNPTQKELVNNSIYQYLLEYKVESPLILDRLGNAERICGLNDVELVIKLFWADGFSPSKISEFVRFSVNEVAEIISEIQFILEKTIIGATRSEITRVAIRMYFYERRPVSQIARDLDVTYLNLYKSIRRLIKNINKNNLDICKHISNIERIAKDEDIQEK